MAEADQEAAIFDQHLAGLEAVLEEEAVVPEAEVAGDVILKAKCPPCHRMRSHLMVLNLPLPWSVV